MALVADRVDIIKATWTNEAFRREVLTGAHQQVVVMTIPVDGGIGEEVHPDTDQVFVFLDGHGEAVLEGATSAFAANDLIFVRAGTRHNIVNTGSMPLRLFTIYAPPQHAVGTVHLTRGEADAAEH